MKIKTHIYCKGCGEKFRRYNTIQKFCKECQYKKQSLKQTRVKPISKKRDKRIKDNGEAKMFKEIWNESDHICYVCESNIPEPLTYVFAHVAPKGTYPELRNIKKNIKLVCSIKCHQKIDDLFSGIKRQEFIRDIKPL